MGSESCPGDIAMPYDQDLSKVEDRFRGRDAMMGGSSKECLQPCWGLKKGGQWQGGFGTGYPASALICMCAQCGISPFFSSAPSRTFCTVTFVPTQGGAPTAADKCHCGALLPTVGWKLALGAEGTAVLPGMWAEGAKAQPLPPAPTHC